MPQTLTVSSPQKYGATSKSEGLAIGDLHRTPLISCHRTMSGMKINIKDADLFNSDDDNDDSDDGEQADVKLWHLAICEWSFF